jgi:hypothetical protein
VSLTFNIELATFNPPMKATLHLTLLFGILLAPTVSGASFDAAPFALPLPDGNGLLWEDPRELHQVVVQFAGTPPPAESVHLQYWGSRWPQQHLPKNREPGGGDVGWMELGNWYQGGWRDADTKAEISGAALVFSFNPVNAKEFPAEKDYPADFRYTLKIRFTSERALPAITRIQAFTDSQSEPRMARLCWAEKPEVTPHVEVFNGKLIACAPSSASQHRVDFEATMNPDPNTLDRTSITVKAGKRTFTVAADDLLKGPIFLPDYGVAVLPGTDSRDYATIAAEQAPNRGKSLYDRVAQMPERTWREAWQEMPPKKSDIYFPLGLDGGRQRFLLRADASFECRANDHYLQNLPGRESPRFKLEPAPVRFRFGSHDRPAARRLQEDSIPICETTWQTNGIRLTQTALLTELDGARADGQVPPADALTVFLVQFVFTNTLSTPQSVTLPFTYQAGDKPGTLRLDEKGFLWLGENLRGQIMTPVPPAVQGDGFTWSWHLAPGQAQEVLFKIPYVPLQGTKEQTALERLDFESQRTAVAGYWRRRLDEGSRLITPEPVLNEFYRADAGHLLINCEREPNSARRFARVGSFAYGAYGNESCMMVVDLDRRGYHREAQECLDAWLHYQGTVALPGDFSSKDGILYGAAGYEAGGYNQHHGWILWMLAEHYRFTRDKTWLNSAAPGIVKGSDWIIRETHRTANRHELERGLLPAGSLEDIGDWWTWLSTSCYTWRGLDAAAWALEQVKHPEAKRIRKEADAFHASLLNNFHKASERSPVVRLRDGTSVPKIPSYVHRRGRSFGWICETLEGAMHLIITGAIDPRSQEALWIIKDYEDNLYLSNQYGYTLDDFDRYWFGRGGMSMQACLLLDVEPYLYRDDVKQALRALFNALAVSHFPDVHMNTEHALPEMGDWRGDHYKSSDESNACGWLRYLFVREEGNQLLLGQAVPRVWLKGGERCGVERAATYFGPVSLVYTAEDTQIAARLEGPTRNAPKQIRLRFRSPSERPISSVTVNGKSWKRFSEDWVDLPGKIGKAEVVAQFEP